MDVQRFNGNVEISALPDFHARTPIFLPGRTRGITNVAGNRQPATPAVRARHYPACALAYEWSVQM
jgi:hypothetical protein